MKLSYQRKELNFCPSSKSVNKEELIDDLFSYCRSIRLKHYFETVTTTKNSNTQTGGTQKADHLTSPSQLQKDKNQDEQCEWKTVYKNPHFDPPSNYSSPNLEKYLAATKTDVLRLAERTSTFSTNMSSAERQTMDSLKKRKDIIITSADKGGKITWKKDFLIFFASFQGPIWGNFDNFFDL